MFKSTKTQFLVLLSLVTAMAASTAHAALPQGATDAMTALATDSASMIDQAWPVVISVTIGFAIIRLFKRSTRSAT